MSVDIEHICIDQDTEYSVEEVLNYGKESGLYDGNFAVAIEGEADWLPGGNVVKFLDAVLHIAYEVLAVCKNPRKKWRLKNDIRKIDRLRETQAEYFADNNQYIGFPTSPHSPLTQHLLNGVDLV